MRAFGRRTTRQERAERKLKTPPLHFGFPRESLVSPETSASAASVSASPAAVPGSLGISAEDTVPRLESRSGPPRRPVTELIREWAANKVSPFLATPVVATPPTRKRV